jgi:preprotein translocase subunit SecG
MMVVLILIHILICAFLVLTVLLQSGKAGDLASAFGGAGSQTAFGTRSAASLLTNLTQIAAVCFMVTCLLLSGWSQRAGSSVMGETTPVSSDAVTQSPDTRGGQESATPAVGSGEETEASESDGADDGAGEQDPDSSF